MEILKDAITDFKIETPVNPMGKGSGFNPWCKYGCPCPAPPVEEEAKPTN